MHDHRNADDGQSVTWLEPAELAQAEFAQMVENPRLREAELLIEQALLARERAVDALLTMAADVAGEQPTLANAAAELAGRYLDPESGPWEPGEADAQARYLAAVDTAREAS